MNFKPISDHIGYCVISQFDCEPYSTYENNAGVYNKDFSCAYPGIPKFDDAQPYLDYAKDKVSPEQYTLLERLLPYCTSFIGDEEEVLTLTHNDLLYNAGEEASYEYFSRDCGDTYLGSNYSNLIAGEPDMIKELSKQLPLSEDEEFLDMYGMSDIIINPKFSIEQKGLLISFLACDIEEHIFRAVAKPDLKPIEMFALAYELMDNPSYLESEHKESLIRNLIYCDTIFRVSGERIFEATEEVMLNQISKYISSEDVAKLRGRSTLECALLCSFCIVDPVFSFEELDGLFNDEQIETLLYTYHFTGCVSQLWNKYLTAKEMFQIFFFGVKGTTDYTVMGCEAAHQWYTTELPDTLQLNNPNSIRRRPRKLPEYNFMIDLEPHIDRGGITKMSLI